MQNKKAGPVAPFTPIPRPPAAENGIWSDGWCILQSCRSSLSYACVAVWSDGERKRKRLVRFETEWAAIQGGLALMNFLLFGSSSNGFFLLFNPPPRTTGQIFPMWAILLR